jgi:hypothetical protein
MNLSISRRSPGGPGFALLMVLGFMVVSFLIISGVLYSTSNAALQTDRHQRYYSTQEAATAAAELVVAGMVGNLQAGVPITVPASIDLKSDMEARSEWGDFEFAFLVQGPAQTQPGLIWKYEALQVENDVYVIQAGARTLDLDTPIASVVEQEIQVAEIPLFAYMGYSEFDLSFVTIPENDITVSGPFHSNRKIYCNPSGLLDFQDNVTSADEIRAVHHPADVATREMGDLQFQKEVDSQANSMRLGPGLGDLYQLLPQMANVADLFVVVSNSVVLVHDGVSSDPISPGVWTNFVSTNVFIFPDTRELKTVHATEIDVAGLRSQQGAIWGAFGVPRLVYLQDVSDYGVDTLAAFRLVNGQRLPSGGLSVVTTNALYVRGNYNTFNRRAAMLAADAVTLVSGAFDDTASAMGAAVDTTLNAAILTGTVPSDEVAGVFDGGYFNALRLIEDWSGRTLNFRGAIATPFASRHANEPWRDVSPFFYAPPTTRVFNHESSFNNLTGSPKGTPILMLHTLIRGELVTTLTPSTLF